MTKKLDWFDLSNQAAYDRWRDWKLAAYPASLTGLIVPIADWSAITDEERQQIQALLDKYNMAIYQTGESAENRLIPKTIGEQFDLVALDNNLGADPEGVTEIRVKASGVHGRYIPYTSRPLSWHTDGYYNTLAQQIRGMALHCVRPAQQGGASELLDHEMAYIYLRDLNSDWIRVLSEPDAMTIPENEVEGKIIRPAQTGPVFNFDAGGQLHMRYTDRKRNIIWKDAPGVAEAVEALRDLFDSDSPWILRGTLQAGQGLLCNNVLHNRRAFEDQESSARLLYRLRYYDRAPTVAAC